MTFEEFCNTVPSMTGIQKLFAKIIWAAATKNALEMAAKKFDGSMPHDWQFADGYSAGNDIAAELREMADRIDKTKED